MEKWLPVSVASNYEVSCQGRIRHAKTRRVRCQRNQDGYKVIRFWVGEKQRDFFVHRVVAIAHLGEPVEDRRMVNHKNCKRDDNRLENLEWVNAKENAVHSAEMRGIGLRKIPDDLLKHVRELRSRRYSLREISEATGLSMSTVNNCCQEGVEVIRIGLAERKKIYRQLSQWRKELGE